ncbi:MAG: class I SAM-dependent methyltransferase, partial [Deltaproteobacteria bacterium]|nr:class I SAM-dependent methyltransferase [Deltaproteobacteria bacterium]
KSIVGIELSKINAKNLKTNLEEDKLDNVEIVNKDWQEVDDDEIKGKFDLVVCSHFLWQVDDVERLLERMENASKKYCAVIQPCGRDEIVKEMFERLTNKKYTGQFEPDADYFAYVILREWGRLVNVRYLDYIHELNLEEEIRYMAGFIGKFMEIDKAVKEMMEKYLLEKKEEAMYREKSSAVVLWWSPDGRRG